MRVWNSVVPIAAGIALAGCIGVGSDASPTTDLATIAATSTPTTTSPPSIAPPTTAAPPTTQTPPPTSAPVTTVAATTPTTTPAPAAEAEVLATLDAFNQAMDRCFEAPAACDLDAILAQYTLPNTTIDAQRRSDLEYYRSLDATVEGSDAIMRTVIETELFDTPGRARTVECERDASQLIQIVDGQRTVDDTVSFYQREYYWETLDGRWVIIESNLTATLDPQEVPSCGYQE